ncbi:hypothetical protein AB5N19_04053 [Seiridium cardinale]
MSLISASIVDQTAVLGHYSGVIGALGPLLGYTLRCQQILSDITLFIVLRSYLIASHLLFLTRILATQAVIISKFLLFNTGHISSRAIRSIWDSPGTRRLRKKLELEFFTFILGGGNSVCLLMFWPGWWVLGFVTLTICCSCVG